MTRGPTGGRPGAGWALEIALVLLLTVIGSRAVSYVSTRHPFVDSGIYASAAMHLGAGRALYRDVWEHKVPGVYVLDRIALGLGDGTMRSIHVMEGLFAVVATLTLFAILRVSSIGPLLAWVFAVLLAMHLYHPALHEGGNLTEEYGVVFVLVMVLLLLLARRGSGRPAIVMTALAGVAAAAAVLTKEPFVCSAVAGGVCVLLVPSVGIPRARAAAVFVAGGVLVFVVFLGWLAGMGAFADWLDVLAYNRRYAATQQREASWIDAVRLNNEVMDATVLGRTITTRVLFVLGLTSAFSPPFRRATAGLPIVALVLLLLDYCGTMVSGLRLPHYFMQITPSYVLTAACGAGFLGYMLRRPRLPEAALASAIVASLLVFDGKACAEFINRVRSSWGTTSDTPLVAYIRERALPDDTLWAGSAFNSRFYVQTGLLSPTKYIYLLDWTLMTTPAASEQEKKDLIAADLRRARPRFLLGFTEGPDVYETVGVKSWLSANYRLVDVRETVGHRLYERLDTVAVERPAAGGLPPSPDAVADTALDEIRAFRFRDAPVRDAVVQVARSVGLTVQPPPRWHPRTVTASFPEQSVLRTLESLLSPADLDFSVTGGEIRVASRRELGEAPPHRRSGCLDLSGDRGRVVVPWAKPMDAAWGLTAEAWVYFRNPSVNGSGIVSRDAPAIGPFVLEVTKDGHLFANVAWANWSDQPAGLKWPALPRKRWVHVALVHDGQKMTLFLEGRPVLDHPVGPSLAQTSNELTIGRKPYNGGTFDGMIDEVRVSRVGRYAGEFVPPARLQPDADTIALYHFDDEPDQKTARDASRNGLHGRIEDARLSPK
jgi:hypothetical protein